MTQKTLKIVRDGRQAKGNRSRVRFLNMGFNDNLMRENYYNSQRKTIENEEQKQVIAIRRFKK